MLRALCLSLVIATLSSCGTAPQMPEPAPSHPASPMAEESPLPTRQATLVRPASEATPAKDEVTPAPKPEVEAAPASKEEHHAGYEGHK